MINPEVAFLYTWDFQNDEEEAEIRISYPPSFNPKAIKIELTDDKTAIKMSIPNEIPFLMGELFAPVTGFSTSIDKNELRVSLTKKEEGQWPFLIKSIHPETKQIDPHSGFIIFYTMEKTDETIEIALNILQGVIAVKYLPAMQYALNAFFQNPESREASFQIAMDAINYYSDPISMYWLGSQLVQNPETVDQGINFLKQADERGVVSARSLVGQIFSPLNDIPFKYKNAEQAVKLFQSVLEQNADDPISNHELAMLYYNGVGVPKDVEKAEDLQKKAKSIIQADQVPDLTVKKPIAAIVDKSNDSNSPTSTKFVDILGAIAVGTVVVGAALTVFKYVSRHK